MFNFANMGSASIPVGLLAVLALLDIVAKAFGLWKAIKNNQMYWFVAIFVINTAGLLPLAYLLFFQPKQQKEVVKASVVKQESKKAKSSKRKSSRK